MDEENPVGHSRDGHGQEVDVIHFDQQEKELFCLFRVV
jgi:hypothetical protein